MVFLQRIDYSSNPYLDKLLLSEQLHFCGAFMHVVRRGDFGNSAVQGGTAKMAVDHVAALFVESGRLSPIINSLGKPHVHTSHQTRGYKKEDPSRN